MPHPLQVASFQDSQGVEVHRTLAPRAAGVHIDFCRVRALVVDHGRHVHAHREISQVLHRQPAALAADKRHHFLGNFALVEQIACGLQPRLSTLAGASALDIDQALECARQVGLNQQIAYPQGLAARIKNLHGAGPLAGVALVQDDIVSAAHQGPMQGCRDGEAARGQLQGWGYHLLKGHGAVAGQGCDPGIDSRGSDRSHDAVGHIATVLTNEVVNAGLGRPTTQAADFAGFTAGSVVDDDGRNAAEAGVLG